MHSIWKTTSGAALVQRLIWPAGLAVALGVTLPFVFFGGASLLTAVATVIGLWVCAAALLDPFRKWVLRQGPPRARAQRGKSLAPHGGDRFEVGGYEILFRDVRQVDGPNFKADEGEFELRKNGELVTLMTSQQRVYRVQQTPMTEAAIDTRIGRDVFIALGEPLGAGAWSVRIQVKPLIRFLWLGSLLMAIGGLLAITDRRYRLPVRAADAAPRSVARPASEAT
jgi:cytochrome c-type biogenesis protein CcmF